MPRRPLLLRPLHALALASLTAALAAACTSKTVKKDAPEEAAQTPEEAPEAEPKRLEASAGPVHVEVIPNFSLVDSRALPGKLDLLVRLRGDEKGQAPRPPLDVAVILDRSGSMSGDKILAVKQAALDLLKQLEPGDRISLLSYSDDVSVHSARVLADAAGITGVRQALLPIEATGGTALGPAMIQGLGLLEEAKRPEEALAHVLLLSDGQANVGESRPEILGARAAEGFGKGVSVSTLGVGLDYNEDLMTKLADQGGGRYHFIQDSQAIPRVLADEMAGLVATVASGMNLELRPADGVKVDAVFGYPTTDEGALKRAKVGSLGAGQSRDIIVRLQLPQATGETMALGVLAVDFADVTAKGERRRAEIALSVDLSADEAKLRDSENTEVTVRVAEVESAAQLEAATRAVATGEYDKAKLLIQQDIDRLEILQQTAKSDDIAAQIADLKEAEANVAKAEVSQEESKLFQKSYKKQAYSKAKGSYATKKKGPSKKKSTKDPFK
ncbi:MAG: VWA domain-containing protein [Myxococcales bacterium]|nr:VWA domain-containing protein [Myxococcales bacterium]